MRAKKRHENLKNKGAADSSDAEGFVPESSGQDTYYVPVTFEGLMEVFGVNLRRKVLYQQFFDKHKQIERMTKQKEITQTEIQAVAREASDVMSEIMSVSIADPSSLKNDHNTLFLSLMDRIKYLKEADA